MALGDATYSPSKPALLIRSISLWELQPISLHAMLVSVTLDNSNVYNARQQTL